LEFIHQIVETFDAYFEDVCELDVSEAVVLLFSSRFLLSSQQQQQIMFNLEKAHMILDEMVLNGTIYETNRNNILAPISLIENAQ